MDLFFSLSCFLSFLAAFFFARSSSLLLLLLDEELLLLLLLDDDDEDSSFRLRFLCVFFPAFSASLFLDTFTSSSDEEPSLSSAECFFLCL